MKKLIGLFALVGAIQFFTACTNDSEDDKLYEAIEEANNRQSDEGAIGNQMRPR
tara:strand:- start:119 stop:280 length:162 start_codon:yes stop_codon:yes gene_type:complete